MEATVSSARAPSEKEPFPIVAIGASAGGLEALRQLLGHLPEAPGMAFIVIQHLDPNRPSALASVLGGDLHMPVVEVTNGMRAEPNRVHVIPPDADISIAGGTLTLVPRQQTGKLHLPIDSFFRALADDQPGTAVGVVLSGSGSDGTEGLRAIKDTGGITFAQDPDSAQFRSMPDSAIGAGVADFRMSPEDIASELTRLGSGSYLVPEKGSSASPDEASLSLVLMQVRRHARLDFRGYKRPTLLRRVARRMALRHFGSLKTYAESLHDDPREARELGEDILIHVTSFFRDPTAFEALQREVLPELLGRKAENGTVRVWVPGCSTGEEAYSLAICLLEAAGEQSPDVSFKIFGSDLSEAAIDRARAGRYSESEVEGVSAERLARFFERTEGKFRITKEVRDLCVFVRHDLTRDPPFAKLDLISCRNVLIYFDAELQERILPLFHHCLAPNAHLFLGSSETVGAYREQFATVDEEHRLFRKMGESPHIEYPRALGGDAESKLTVQVDPQRRQPARDAQRQADHVLLARYAPPAVLVNERFEIVQFRGRTGEYLEPAPGMPQARVLQMAREGLAGPLRGALEKARAESTSVQLQGVQITDETRASLFDVEVIPLAASAERFFLVVFADIPSATTASPQATTAAAPLASASRDDQVARLKAELGATRDYLQAINGEHQDTTAELAAVNEELVATNEELQSTNEELLSAKEELQSTNEELSTVNDELRRGNQKLDSIANDLVNVLEGVQIPVIMVDQALRIRRFTPTAREISSLQPADVGRSIDDVKLRLRIDDLGKRIQMTIDTVSPQEWEVQGTDGRWFRMHVRPYRTADNRLDGAILSFLDVDVLRQAVQTAERARDYAQGIVETVPISLLVLDEHLQVTSANPRFHRLFGTSPAAVKGADAFAIAGGTLARPALKDAIERSLATRRPFGELEVPSARPDDNHPILSVSACPIQGAGGDLLLLLAIEDVTERRMLEASEKNARLEAEQANRAKDLFLATLSHELRTPLGSILLNAQLLQTGPNDEAKVARASAAIARAVRNQANLIDDLLDVSRIVSGKLMLSLEDVNLESVVQNAIDMTRDAAQAKGIELVIDLRAPASVVHADPARLNQVVSNLLTNAIKFTPRGGKIGVSLESEHGQANLRVTDSGIGVRADALPFLFDRFVQAETSITRAYGGLGLGLAIVRHLVHAHGGTVRAESAGVGHGATFTVTLPLMVRDFPILSEAPRPLAFSIAGTSVLVIDDEDDSRDACTAMLAQLGAVVRSASSATAGLAAVEEHRPEVILCDIAMPGEDGYSFVRSLRALPEERGGKTPAAALTALATVEDRKRAIDAGFQLHLAKPIDALRLGMAVLALSGSKANAAANGAE